MLIFNQLLFLMISTKFVSSTGSVSNGRISEEYLNNITSILSQTNHMDFTLSFLRSGPSTSQTPYEPITFCTSEIHGLVSTLEKFGHVTPHSKELNRKLGELLNNLGTMLNSFVMVCNDVAELSLKQSLDSSQENTMRKWDQLLSQGDGASLYLINHAYVFVPDANQEIVNYLLESLRFSQMELEKAKSLSKTKIDSFHKNNQTVESSPAMINSSDSQQTQSGLIISNVENSENANQERRTAVPIGSLNNLFVSSPRIEKTLIKAKEAIVRNVLNSLSISKEAYDIIGSIKQMTNSSLTKSNDNTVRATEHPTSDPPNIQSSSIEEAEKKGDGTQHKSPTAIQEEPLFMSVTIQLIQLLEKRFGDIIEKVNAIPAKQESIVLNNLNSAELRKQVNYEKELAEKIDNQLILLNIVNHLIEVEVKNPPIINPASLNDLVNLYSTVKQKLLSLETEFDLSRISPEKIIIYQSAYPASKTHQQNLASSASSANESSVNPPYHLIPHPSTLPLQPCSSVTPIAQAASDQSTAVKKGLCSAKNHYYFKCRGLQGLRQDNSLTCQKQSLLSSVTTNPAPVRSTVSMQCESPQSSDLPPITIYRPLLGTNIPFNLGMSQSPVVPSGHSLSRNSGPLNRA